MYVNRSPGVMRALFRMMRSTACVHGFNEQCRAMREIGSRGPRANLQLGQHVGYVTWRKVSSVRSYGLGLKRF
jgi:hypothetical protein